MVAAAASAGWLFGLSFVNSVLLVLMCIMLPFLAYKFYVANAALHLQHNRKRELVPDVFYPYGVEEIQGKRSYMEDRHVEVANIGGDPTASVYGVFDGHGGCRASDFCVDNLVPNLVSSANLMANPHKALARAFVETDIQFMKLARKFKWDDGTTACVAIVIGKRVIVANAGDTRAVVVQRQGRVVAMSFDHKPHRVDERDRIKRLGGSVFLVGVWRVEGILAVSRAIGDRQLKRYVTSMPDIKEREVSPLDRYLVIATDGLWDVMSNEEVGDTIFKIHDPQRAAGILVDCAYTRGSADNITVMVIDLQHPRNPKVGRATSAATNEGVVDIAARKKA